MRIDISEVSMKVPYPVFIPLGLPQGIRVEPSKGQVTGGVVTRGGERIVVDPLSYSLWLTMQLGLSEKQLVERFKAQLGTTDYNVSLTTLTDKGLVHKLSSFTETDFFSKVRVIPKATGVGSVDKEHALRYIVKPNFGDKEVVMNPLDYAIWTMWDGKASLMHTWREGARHFQLKLPDVIPRQVGTLLLLLGQGLLNLDYV
ncbi:MAG: hypothetical protein JRN09_05885 [Nitrososphaerota archaeon]|nr:hypothetical protein [Nitrososphaerota archaeon]